MTVTKILGAQAGIQYQGVVDKSEADPRDNLVNALFTGQFKNGPFNKPFKVTAANIRKALGFDPENLQYQAIEDLLKQGVPFVWVMRVSKENGPGDELYISPNLQYGDDQTERSIRWDVEVNGTYYEADVNDDGNYMEDYLEANQNTLGITGEHDSSLRIYNITNTRKFVRFIPNHPYTSNMKLTGNSTVSIDPDGVISFWLEANNNPPKPVPEPEPAPVPVPTDWDIKYKVYGDWIYEKTGPIVELSEERNNLYRNVATELVFNDTVTEVGNMSFKFWNTLVSVDLGQSVTRLGVYSFEMCKSLLKLIIPNSVKTIANNALGGCEKISLLDIGTGLELIDEWALVNLYNLNTLVFRGPVAPTVKGYAFGNGGSGGTNPLNIYIPDNLFTEYAESLWNLTFGTERFKPLSTYTP